MKTQIFDESRPSEHLFLALLFSRRVWLTYAIVALNIAIFCLMVAVSSNPKLALIIGGDYPSLINFGAKTNFWLLQHKQWFRLVTPIFLHLGLMHLAINCYSLWQVGPFIEKLYGTTRFAWLYLLTGIGGVIGSVVGTLVNHLDGPSAGASGALFGLLGVILTASYKLRRDLPEEFLQQIRKGVVPTIILNLLFGILYNSPSLFSKNAPGQTMYIGNWAHGGGLVCGIFLGLIFPYDSPSQKKNRALENIIFSVCIFIVGCCFLLAFLFRPYKF